MFVSGTETGGRDQTKRRERERANETWTPRWTPTPTSGFGRGGLLCLMGREERPALLRLLLPPPRFPPFHNLFSLSISLPRERGRAGFC